MNNNYMVITADCKNKIKDGFKTWDDAYYWIMEHDFGQYKKNGGLVVCRNFKI